MGSPPPLGLPSTERPLSVCVTPPLPPLSSFPWELVAAPLCGRRLCSVLLSGDSFIINRMSIWSYCVQTELNDCPDHHVNSSLATFLNTSLCVNFHFPSLFLSFPFLCFPLISFSSFKFTFFSFSSFIPSSSSRFFSYYIFFFFFLISFFLLFLFIYYYIFFLSQSHLTSSFAAFDSRPHLMWIAFDSDTCVSDTCVPFAPFLTVLYFDYIYVFCDISRWGLSICSYASSPNLLWCISCMSQ